MNYDKSLTQFERLLQEMVEDVGSKEIKSKEDNILTKRDPYHNTRLFLKKYRRMKESVDTILASTSYNKADEEARDAALHDQDLLKQLDIAMKLMRDSSDLCEKYYYVLQQIYIVSDNEKEKSIISRISKELCVSERYVRMLKEQGIKELSMTLWGLPVPLINAFFIKIKRAGLAEDVCAKLGYVEIVNSKAQEYWSKKRYDVIHFDVEEILLQYSAGKRYLDNARRYAKETGEENIVDMIVYRASALFGLYSLIEKTIDRIETEGDELSAQILRLNFLDCLSKDEILDELGISKNTYYKKRKYAYAQVEIKEPQLSQYYMAAIIQYIRSNNLQNQAIKYLAKKDA